MQQVSYGPLIMSIMLIMSCYTGFFNVRREWQSLNTGPRFYLRLIRRTDWLWIYTSRTTDGRPFKPKKSRSHFYTPGFPQGWEEVDHKRKINATNIESVKTSTPNIPNILRGFFFLPTYYLSIPKTRYLYLRWTFCESWICLLALSGNSCIDSRYVEYSNVIAWGEGIWLYVL